LVFDGTIRENIVLNEIADDLKLSSVLEKVGLEHLGLDTIVGERGILLSG
jgi:ABC-type transport system involved in cytochrome bd biosynthesis fused ATPase/permease subunit